MQSDVMEQRKEEKIKVNLDQVKADQYARLLVTRSKVFEKAERWRDRATDNRPFKGAVD